MDMDGRRNQPLDEDTSSEVWFLWLRCWELAYGELVSYHCTPSSSLPFSQERGNRRS